MSCVTAGPVKILQTDAQSSVLLLHRVIDLPYFAKRDSRGRILFGFLDLVGKHGQGWQVFAGLNFPEVPGRPGGFCWWDAGLWTFASHLPAEPSRF